MADASGDHLTVDVADMSARIQEVFAGFDKDGSGKLDMLELREVFRTLSPSFDAKQISYYCKWLNEAGDGDGQVSHKEFMRWLLEGSHAALEVSKVIIAETGSSISARLREVFQRFDKDGGGFLDMAELSRVFRVLSPSFTIGDIRKLCQELDRGGDQKVSRTEFMAWLRKGGEQARFVTSAILSSTGNQREKRIKTAFHMYEATGDGMLDIDELRTALQNLGSFSLDEVRHVCADLDKTKDGRISFEEFAAWIKTGTGVREIEKAKAILAPSDTDGLEAVFYNFCGAGKADMDGKGFLKVCEDCDLLDKKLNVTAVDLIFCDNRVKLKGQRTIDFVQFEIALELVAEKKGIEKQDVRSSVLVQGKPRFKTSAGHGRESTFTGLSAGQVAGKAGSRRFKKAANQVKYLKVSSKEIENAEKEAAEQKNARVKDQPKKDWDISNVWKVFGLHSSAGRSLKTIYCKDRQSPRMRPWAERAGTPKRLRNPPSRKPRSHVIPAESMLDICVQVVSTDVYRG